jgi:hypothetical protein
MRLKLRNISISFILIISIVKLEATENKYPETRRLTARILDSNVEKPKEGKPSIDYHYNTIIKKVSKADKSLSSYPKIQSWNKDMTLFRISNRFYNADTLKESKLTRNYNNSDAYKHLCSRYSDYFRWSNVEANRFYLINTSQQFIEGTILDNDIDCSNVLESFKEYELLHIGPYEGNIDYSDRYVVFIAKKPHDTRVYIILYNIKEEKRVWTKELTNNKWMRVKGTWKLSSLDWISISPSGRYIVINESDANGGEEGIYRYDIEFKNRVKLKFEYQGKSYSQGGHADMGYDMNGNEVLIQFIGGVGVYQFNLERPDLLGQKILNVYGGGHVSCRNTERQGWCYITTHAKNYRDIFALKLDGSDDENVQNFTQSHMLADMDKTYGSPSPDGRRVIFNSDWGSGDMDHIDTFVVTAD